MTIYDPKRHRDGTLELSDEQRFELAEKGFSSEQVFKALLNLYELTKPAKKGEIVAGMTPCPECGGLDFMITGNCHVCVTCGASQGCS